MDDNFSSNPNSMPPSSPGFGGSNKPPFNPVPIVILVIIIAAGGYIYQSSSGMFKDFGSSLSSAIDEVEKAVNEEDSRATNQGAIFNNNNSDNNSADADLTEKLNAYVDMLNYVSDNVYSSYDRYGQWVDLEKGPTGAERNVYGLYQLNDHDRYFENSQIAYDLEPKIDLDQDFPPYRDAYLKLKPLLEEAYTYYDQEDYKDDNFAKGKQMHGDLVAAFKAFDEANNKLSADYEVVDIAQRQKEIEQYKTENRMVAYESASTLYLGQQMYINLRDQMNANGNDASKLNADELKTFMDKLDAQITKLKANENKKSEIEKEYGITGDSLFSSFVDKASGFLKSTKSLYRGLRDGNLPERDNFSDSTEGTPENFIYTYNEMVDAFNFMNRF